MQSTTSHYVRVQELDTWLHLYHLEARVEHDLEYLPKFAPKTALHSQYDQTMGAASLRTRLVHIEVLMISVALFWQEARCTGVEQQDGRYLPTVVLALQAKRSAELSNGWHGST